MSTCLGKLLIIISLIFQAYILFKNQTVADSFDVKLQDAVEACQCIPQEYAGHILQHGRLVIVGILGSSVLIIFFRCWFFKLLPLLALSFLFYIEYQPFTKVPWIGCTRFWEKIAVIGAVIYLMVAEFRAGSCKKPCAQKSQKPAATLLVTERRISENLITEKGEKQLKKLTVHE